MLKLTLFAQIGLPFLPSSRILTCACRFVKSFSVCFFRSVFGLSASPVTALLLLPLSLVPSVSSSRTCWMSLLLLKFSGADRRLLQGNIQCRNSSTRTRTYKHTHPHKLFMHIVCNPAKTRCTHLKTDSVAERFNRPGFSSVSLMLFRARRT